MNEFSVIPAHTCVFGLGWGDEGKGKVVDLLCPSFDVVVRFNGGANAGHTVCIGEEKFALHLLPTGVLHEQITAIIGPGVVADPLTLLSEIDALAARGIDVLPRLKISERTHVVLAYHKLEDQLSERAASSGEKIGTTARGIGPCYADKMRRSTAVRFGDLLHEATLADRVRRIAAMKSATLRVQFASDGGLSAEGIVADLSKASERLAACIGDTTEFLNESIENGKRLLFEGANGVLLDVDHGTYPFVTSSSTGPHGIGPGAGVPETQVGCRIGVAKAYSTRVGSGPFVSELADATGDLIRERGHEYGTTTGRPRRCGWFDAVAARYSATVSGATDLALLHLDTLSGFERIGICTAYEISEPSSDAPSAQRGSACPLTGLALTPALSPGESGKGRRVRSMPAGTAILEKAKPVFEYMPGWSEELGSVRRFEDLPQNARKYVERIEVLVGVPASILGVGPERSQTILRSGSGGLDLVWRHLESLQVTP